MNANTIYRAFKSFVFNRVFLVGFVTGFIISVVVASLIFGTAVNLLWSISGSFILGTITGFFGNYLWEWYKKKERGTEQYCDVSVTGDIITLAVQMPNTRAAQTVTSKAMEIATPPDLKNNINA